MMRREIVLVRALGGEPVRLIAVGAHSGLIYVANPASLARIDTGETGPVGVPAEDVFEYDETAFVVLRRRWDEAGAVSREEWREYSLALYRPDDAGELAA